MRKKILTMSLLCSMAMGANAQVYAYDTWMQMPTRDIYDDGAMNMYVRALAEGFQQEAMELRYLLCKRSIGNGVLQRGTFLSAWLCL